MAPKQKGGGAPKQRNAAEEVEETLQAVVCSLYLKGILLTSARGCRVIVYGLDG